MGIIGNLITSRIVQLNNSRRNHLGTHLVDFISTDRTLLLCGGEKGSYNRRGEYRLSIAEETRLETFFTAVEDAQRSALGAVCFYATHTLPSPDISQVRLRSDYIAFGHNASYSPLVTSDNSLRSVYAFFERVIGMYCQRRRKANDHVICGTISMLLRIIDCNLGSGYLTLDNIGVLAGELSGSDLTGFEDAVEGITGRPFLPEWENYLVLNWDESARQFHEFWDNFSMSVSRYTSRQGPQESLYTALLDRKACFCPLGPGDDFLRDIMLCELEMVYWKSPGYKFVSYYVPLPDAFNYRFLAEGMCCLIGDSLRTLNVKGCLFQDLTILCLGVSAGDAKDILETMVASGTWVQAHMGFGPRNVHFHSVDRKPITERDLSLSQLQQGGAYRLSRDGCTRIWNLFV